MRYLKTKIEGKGTYTNVTNIADLEASVDELLNELKEGQTLIIKCGYNSYYITHNGDMDEVIAEVNAAISGLEYYLK